MTTSKFSRLRSKQPVSAAAAAATTTTAAAATTTNKFSNSYFSKLKTKSFTTTTIEPATLSLATSSLASATNVDSPAQKQQQQKFQAASYALRRQFQKRRLTTTPTANNAADSATELPRTQNPLFKRRPTLTSGATTPRTTTIATDTTTVPYGIDDDEDQVAKSSIHTSRFNQIPEQVRPRTSYEPTASSNQTTAKSSPPTSTAAFTFNNTRRQLVPRPRRPQSASPTSITTTSGPISAPPAARRQHSRRRPHKYIEVYNRPVKIPALTTAQPATKLQAGLVDYEYYDTNPQLRRRHDAQRQTQSQSELLTQSQRQPQSQPKVIVHGRGIIECLDQGNFPHPLSCRKFISCAKFDETGGIVGWEYTCPKGLGYDGTTGMCIRTALSEAGVCRD